MGDAIYTQGKFIYTPDWERIYEVEQYFCEELELEPECYED